MKILAATALAIVAAMAVGASAQPSGGASPPPKPRPSCFWTSRIENFAAVDEQNLYLRVGIRDVYRAKLFSNCFDIDWVHHLALVSLPKGDGLRDKTALAISSILGKYGEMPGMKLRQLPPAQKGQSGAIVLTTDLEL